MWSRLRLWRRMTGQTPTWWRRQARACFCTPPCRCSTICVRPCTMTGARAALGLHRWGRAHTMCVPCVVDVRKTQGPHWGKRKGSMPVVTCVHLDRRPTNVLHVGTHSPPSYLNTQLRYSTILSGLGENQASQSKSTVVLPPVSPIRVAEGRWMRTRDEAKASACVEAIRLLHQVGTRDTAAALVCLCWCFLVQECDLID